MPAVARWTARGLQNMLVETFGSVGEVCWTGLEQVLGGVAECLEETLLRAREEG